MKRGLPCGTRRLLRRIHWSGFLTACIFLSGCLSLAQQPGAGPKQGEALFARNCASCHGSDGRGGEHAPDIATNPAVVGMPDSQLNEILNKGILSAGMPAYSYLGADKLKSLVGYLRFLEGITGAAQGSLPGDPHEGEALFHGSASCSGCHMVKGRGGFLGEDLTEYARGRSADAVRAAIVHPPDAPDESGHLAEIVISENRTLRGLVRWRDNFTVILQSEDGAFHSIPRDRIRKMSVSSQSLMPGDYAQRLNEKQLNDLVSYLLKSAGSGKTARAEDDSDD